MELDETELKKEAAFYLGSAKAMQDEKRDSEAIREIEDVTPESVAAEIRDIKEILSFVDDKIVKLRSEYGMTDMNRENLEKLYAVKMDLLYHLAFGLHPLVTYGRQCLKKAIDTRIEFEALAGGFTTRVTAKNIHVFMPVLTRDMAEDILTGRREAIGAIRSKKMRSFGAGVLVYYVDSGLSPDEPVLRIEWLYVHENFRGRRIADTLIAEMIYQMHENHIEAMTVSFAVGASWEPSMGTVFSRWRFLFGAQMEPDTIINMADISDYEMIEKYSHYATPLSALDEKTIPHVLEKKLKDAGYRGYLWSLTRNPTYFDRNLSCFTGDVHSPDGIMLVHITPSGICRVEYLEPGKQGLKAIPGLVTCFLNKAARTVRADSVLDIPIRMDEFDKLMNKFVPKQESSLLVTAVLSAPISYTDVDEGMIEELLLEA